MLDSVMAVVTFVAVIIGAACLGAMAMLALCTVTECLVKRVTKLR